MTQKRPQVDFTTPTGRLVWGNPQKAMKKTNQDGTDKLTANGADAGQVLYMFEFGIAIPKTQAHWGTEPDWGQKLWAEGHACWPAGQTQRADFSWKVTDGDSTIPNKKQKKPCDQEGYPGCWILNFSGKTAPKIYSSVNGAPVEDPSTNIRPGDDIQVMGSMCSNNSTLTAGMYLNHAAVCYRGNSKGFISSGPVVDPSGFGHGLAPGATAAAPFAPQAQAQTAPPAAPAPVAPPPAPVTPPPAPTAAPQVPVTPNPAYTPAGAPAAPGAPVPPAPPAPPAAPAAPAEPAITAKALAESTTYAALKLAGWNDQQMREHGYIV